jgi:hypothetical protein
MLNSHYITKVSKHVCMWSLSLLFLLGIVVFPQTVSALTREQLQVEILNDFVIEPTKNEVLITPGENAVRNISVINRTERTITFTVDIEDIVGSDNPDDQVKLLGDERGPYSLKDFLLPEVREFTVKSGERVSIPITVSLPMDAEPRGYYGAVIISAKDQETEGSVDKGATGVTKLVTRLGSLFLVRVAGEIEERSVLEVFKPLGSVADMFSSHPEGFELAVRNDGNVHLVHFGEVTIRNMFGREVTRLPINAFFSLPDMLRYREVRWPASFSIGYYTATIDLYKGFGEFEQSMHTSKISFWVLPWHVVLPIILIASLLVWLVRHLKKNFTLTRR